MNIYDMFMFPLEKMFLTSLRRKLIPKSRGDVLEIGAGTGVNFKYYKRELVSEVTIVDKELNKIAENRALNNMKFQKADAVSLLFEDNSFDTVVETLLLCSVDAEGRAVEEIHRVLKPDGLFIHIDHRLPSRRVLKGIFNFLAPA